MIWAARLGAPRGGVRNVSLPTGVDIFHTICYHVP